MTHIHKRDNMVDRSISNKMSDNYQKFCPTLKTFPRISAHDKLSKRRTKLNQVIPQFTLA